MNEGRQMLNEEENQRKEKLKEVVAECFIKGYNKARTIERVLNVTGEKLYYRKLNGLLDEVLSTWSAKGIKDKVLMRAVELKKIDVRESELWQAWEDSKMMDDGADARYLAELRRCSEQRSRLLGLALGKDGSKTGKVSVVWNEKKSYGTDNKTD